MELVLNLLADHPKNVLLWVRGQGGGCERILEVGKLVPPPRSLLLASVVWTLEEKLGLYVWTHRTSRRPQDMLLVMESRNSMRFDHELLMPEDWEGELWIESFKEDNEAKRFMFLLDFDKASPR